MKCKSSTKIYHPIAQSALGLLAALCLLTTACTPAVTPPNTEAAKQSEAFRKQAKEARERSNFLDALILADSAMSLGMEAHDTILMVQACNEMATSFRRMGRLEQAIRFHTEALIYAESCHDTCFQARKNVVISCNGLGNVYLSLGDNEQAEIYFRRALAGEKALRSDLGQAINYANLGAIHESRLQLDSAMLYYRRSLHHNQLCASQLGIGLCHVYFGSVQKRRGAYDKALAEFEQAHELFAELGDTWHALTPTLSIADLYLETNRPQEAKPYIDTVMAEAERMHSLEYLAEAYQLHSRYHEQCGQLRDALADFRQAAAYKDSVSGPVCMNETRNVYLSYEKRCHERQLSEIQTYAELQQRQYNYILLLTWLLMIAGTIAIALTIYLLRYRIIMFFSNVLHRNAPDDSSELSQSDRLWLDGIKLYVEKKMPEGNVTSEDLASHLALSVSTMQRRLRLLTGDSVGHYVTNIRMERARQLLLSTDLSIREVGEQCGFFDTSYFGRAFRKFYDMTPGQMRQQGAASQQGESSQPV